MTGNISIVTKAHRTLTFPEYNLHYWRSGQQHASPISGVFFPQKGRTGNWKMLKTYATSHTKQSYKVYGILFILEKRKRRLSKVKLFRVTNTLRRIVPMGIPLCLTTWAVLSPQGLILPCNHAASCPTRTLLLTLVLQNSRGLLIPWISGCEGVLEIEFNFAFIELKTRCSGNGYELPRRTEPEHREPSLELALFIMLLAF